MSGGFIVKAVCNGVFIITGKKMPRKRKSRLTLGKKYLKEKRRKTTKPLQANWTDLQILHANNDDDDDDGDSDVDGCSSDTAENEDLWSSQETLQTMFPIVLEKVIENGKDEFLLALFNLIMQDKFPFDSIIFVLFSEFLDWLSVKTTTQMRYSSTSKEFWWTGNMLFGGKFLRFMQGFKHKGFITTGKTTRGEFDPALTNINFAVPSDRILSSYCPVDALKDCKGVINPGPIQPMLDIYGAQSSRKSHVLAFDGKKIIPNSAEIDLMGCEDDETLNQQKCVEEDSMYIAKLEGIVETLGRDQNQHLADSVSGDERSSIIDTLLDCLRCISNRMQNIRLLKDKKAYALKKLQEKDASATPKDHYLMNYLKTFVLQSSNVLDSGLDSLNCLCEIISILNESSSDFVRGDSLCLDNQRNYSALLNPADMRKHLDVPPDVPLPSSITQQRSDEWFELRKDVRVTGSTVSKAIGVDSLKEQKLFVDHHVVGPTPPPSEFVQTAMTYGTDNEINAVATLVGKVMPVLFPSLVFCEEGAYVITDEDTGGKLLIVSPDGSLREGENGIVDTTKKAVVSVEIKCPYSCSIDVASVYSSVPKRHICQSLMEHEVLNSDKHILLCWTKTSTTVFEIPSDPELVKDILTEVKTCYHTDVIRKPTRRSRKAIAISEKVDNHRKSCQLLGEFPSICRIIRGTENFDVRDGYPYKIHEKTVDGESLVTTGDACKMLLQCITTMKNAIDLYNKKASEVVVFTLADSDREWSQEIGHSIPVGYFFKGYSLTTQVMRNIANKMYASCLLSDLDVSCITFDGQWFKLLEESAEGMPLTLFQLHRNHWKNICKYSARELLDLLCKVRSTVKYEVLLEPTKRLLLYSDEPCIRSSGRIVLRQTISESERNQNVVDDESDIKDSHCKGYTLTDDDKDAIGDILRKSSRKRRRFSVENTSRADVTELFSSAEKIDSLNDSEIKDVLKYINQKKGISEKVMMKGNKSNRVWALCVFLGLSVSEEKVPSQRRVTKSPPSLKQILRVHMKAKGKRYLEAVYAQYTWDHEERRWRDALPLKDEIFVQGVNETFIPVYSPERVTTIEGERLRLSCVDGHHLRSNIRAKLCRTGTETLSKQAWIDVANSRKTPLTIAMVSQNSDGKIMDQQDDRLIRTMFCEEVEEELRNQGYAEEALFTCLIRNWYDAEDMPGIPAVERCHKALKLRTWMLRNVSFSDFPPPGGAIKGIPRISFEGIVCNIEAHLYMYSVSKSKTYNWRSMSTLAAENFFGEIAEMESHTNGVPSGTSFKRDISVITGLNAVRMNPNRYLCLYEFSSISLFKHKNQSFM